MKKIILIILVSSFMNSLWAKQHPAFVEVKNMRFERHGKPYYFLGTNFWQGMNLGAPAPIGDRALLLRELDKMKSVGIKQLRIMALSEGPDASPYRVVPAVQTSPGVYNEKLLQGLDYLLIQMKKRGMTAVMCLNNFWPWSGGMGQWVAWAEGSSIPYPPPHPNGSWDVYQEYASHFYLLPKAMEANQASIKKIITRVNSLNQVPYSKDPTIMAWELANEPRGGKYRKDFLKWISTTAQMIKDLDKNHLLTIGSEGQTLSPENAGNDFIEDHALTEIDYATIHIWMENWGVYQPTDAQTTFPKALEALKNYIENHASLAKNFKKPIIIEEFGLARDGRSMDPKSSTQNRDLYYTAAFQLTLDYLKQDGIISGINFWAWSGETYPNKPYGGLWKPGDKLLGDPPHEEQGWYGVYSSDTSTLDVIKNFAKKFNDITK